MADGFKMGYGTAVHAVFVLVRRQPRYALVNPAAPQLGARSLQAFGPGIEIDDDRTLERTAGPEQVSEIGVVGCGSHRILG